VIRKPKRACEERRWWLGGLLTEASLDRVRMVRSALDRPRSISMEQSNASLKVRTPSIAFFTLSDVIRPWLAKFSMSASFVAPDDLHAMLMLRRAGTDAWLPILLAVPSKRLGEYTPTVIAHPRATTAAENVWQYVMKKTCQSRTNVGCLAWSHFNVSRGKRAREVRS
jgi:hypothetical protein